MESSKKLDTDNLKQGQQTKVAWSQVCLWGLLCLPG